MDTFNFSFFEDKPQESDKDTEATSSPATSAPSESEASGNPVAEDDPFGFSAFAVDESETEAAPTELTGEAEESEAPPATLDLEDEFDMSSLSPGFGANGSEAAEFPDVALAAEDTSSADPLDLNFDDLGVEAEGTSDTFADTDFGFDSLVSDEEVAEANDDLGLGSLDTVELAGPILTPTPETTPEPEALAEPEPATAPEIEPVVAPLEPEEIRAAVEPAVFLTPAPTTPVPMSEPEETEEESARPARESRERAKSKPARFLTADDPYGEVAPPRERLRVAVLGASGIGKNHARWFAKNSCDVVSFLGSSDESVQLTRSHLEAHMSFTGQGYSDLGRLLNETQPQAVCIASPSDLHYAQAMQCLEAGIHVLCEKPLVYAPARTKRENLDGARELLKVAARRNLVLATQLQYGAATPILCRLAGVSPYEVGDFAMEIETTNPKSPRDPRELWIDLAPHPLSVAQYLAGEGAEIVQETLQIMPSRSAYTSEVTARFGVRCNEGRLLMCRVIVRWFDKIVDNREQRRRFSFNGRVVQYSGVKSPDGTYIAQYVAPDGYISHYSDPVDYLIGNFVRTCWDEDALILSSEQGVQNLDWLLSTAEKL